MSLYVKPKNDVLEVLESNQDTGLSSQKVNELKAKFGENRLSEKKKKTSLQRFADQFKDVMIIILIIAAIVSFVIDCVELNPKEFFETALILLIVILRYGIKILVWNSVKK